MIFVGPSHRATACKTWSERDKIPPSHQISAPVPPNLKRWNFWVKAWFKQSSINEKTDLFDLQRCLPDKPLSTFPVHRISTKLQYLLVIMTCNYHSLPLTTIYFRLASVSIALLYSKTQSHYKLLQSESHTFTAANDVCPLLRRYYQSPHWSQQAAGMKSKPEFDRRSQFAPNPAMLCRTLMPVNWPAAKFLVSILSLSRKAKFRINAHSDGAAGNLPTKQLFYPVFILQNSGWSGATHA